VLRKQTHVLPSIVAKAFIRICENERDYTGERNDSNKVYYCVTVLSKETVEII
jgi:hypothetical protein